MPFPEEVGGEEVFRDVRLPFTNLYLPSPSLNRPNYQCSGLIHSGEDLEPGRSATNSVKSNNIDKTGFASSADMRL